MQTIERNGLELRELRYFVATADSGSFTEGARLNGVSQSALSQTIRQIEERYGLALFDRGERQIRLTAAGEELLQHARRVLTAASESSAALMAFSAGNRGRLTVGVVQTVNALVMPRVLRQLLGESPEARFEVCELPAPEIEEGVANGALDLGIGFHPVAKPSLEIQPQGQEDLVLVRCGQHAGEPTGGLEAAGVATLPLVLLSRRFCTRNLIDRGFAEAGMAVSPLIEMTSVEGILSTVRTSDIATILPRMALETHAGQGLVGQTINGVSLRRRLLILWRRTGYRSPLAKRFAQIVGRELGAN